MTFTLEMHIFSLPSCISCVGRAPLGVKCWSASAALLLNLHEQVCTYGLSTTDVNTGPSNSLAYFLDIPAGLSFILAATFALRI